MAKFQVTFEKPGKKTLMVIDAPNPSNALDVASFFELSHGKLNHRKVVAVKA
jgi:hypothetical protein